MPVYDQYDPNDPYSLLDLGQQYNPSQGYPLKQVSDQIWDLISPTPDYLIAQQFGALTPWRDKFSTDAFFAADPLLRGPLSEALSRAKGDSIGAYSQLQSDEMRDRLLAQIGRTEWDELANRGDLGVIGAITPEEKDQAALDFYMRGLEDILAAGAPTTQRNQAQYDYVAERMGGRPYPGAGGTYPGFSGPGFGGGGGSDPLADLAVGSGSREAVSRQGTPFGEGISDVGAAAGADRLDFGPEGRYAIVGGRRYQLPETMAGPGGSNPAYQSALRRVLTERASRQGREVGSPYGGERKRESKGKSIGSGILKALQLGDLISNPF